MLISWLGVFTLACKALSFLFSFPLLFPFTMPGPFNGRYACAPANTPEQVCNCSLLWLSHANTRHTLAVCAVVVDCGLPVCDWRCQWIDILRVAVSSNWAIDQQINQNGGHAQHKRQLILRFLIVSDLLFVLLSEIGFNDWRLGFSWGRTN